MALISIRGLRKYYRMGESIVHALDGVDLDIEKGEFVAITGASGSGKSTMMHLLGCLDRPTAGTFHLNGRNVSEMSDRELARVRNEEIGFVFQTFNLINRTSALDNVGVPMFYARAANTRGPARRALERVGLTQRADHTPSELSGGERQRVAIARAIVNDPLLVLADEPTGNLDTRTGEQIMEIFRTLNRQGVTVILVTHEQDVALQANRIVQMRDGKIVLDKPTAELVRDARNVATGQTGAGGIAIGQPGVDSLGVGGTLPASGPIPSVKQKNQGLIKDFGGPAWGISDATPAMRKPVPETVAARPNPSGLQLNPTAETPEVQLPPRVASGSYAVLIFGILTPVMLLVGMVIAGYFQHKYANFVMTPGQTPPTDLVVGGFAAASLILLSVITGVISFIWGRAVRRRIREVPGNWIGGKRALTGLICGGSTLLLLLLWIGLIVTRVILKAKSA